MNEPKTVKSKNHREIVKAWNKVYRLGKCYLDLSAKKNSVRASLIEAVAEVGKLEHNPIDPNSWRFWK